MVDNGEGTNATAKDRFGIRVATTPEYLVPTQPLGDDDPGGGDVKLHKHNTSNFLNGNPSEIDMCGGLENPDAGPTPPPPPPGD
jgi:hypothetical protein